MNKNDMNTSLYIKSENGKTETGALASNIINGSLSVRGSLGSVYAEEAELQRRMMKARMQNPAYYAYSDEIDRDKSNKYRTGVDKDGCYMTVDDYIRFCYDKQSSCRINQTNISAPATADVNGQKRPAHAYTCVNLSRAQNALSARDTVFMGEQHTELHVTSYKSKKSGVVQYLGQKYVGNEKVVNSGIDFRHAQGTIASVALVIILAVTLIVPIVMKVMIFNERNTVESLKSEISEEQAEIVQLENKIDIKNKEADIERLAVETYGMTSIDESFYTVIKLNPEDIIEKAEKSETKGGAVPALLNALGIRIRTSD